MVAHSPGVAHAIASRGGILIGKFAARAKAFAGGRKIIVEILDAPSDLTDPEASRSFEAMVRDQIERFGSTLSNVFKNYIACSFYSEILIGRAEWEALAKRRSIANAVEAVLSLAACKGACSSETC